MGRNPRPFVPGGTYHLTAHGIDDRPIFVDDADRQSFALRLRRVAIRDRWLLHAVCLLGTHYHLVVQPSRDLSSGMRVLNGATLVSSLGDTNDAELSLSRGTSSGRSATSSISQ